MQNDKLTREQLIGKHGRLRQELVVAFADAQGPARQPGRVERLLAELRDIEARLAPLDSSIETFDADLSMPRAA